MIGADFDSWIGGTGATDNGTGSSLMIEVMRIPGEVRSIFRCRPLSGTDHQSFDQVGLPGFQFIQDSVEYGRMTHHSNMDLYDHAVPDDLMQASAVIASIVYHAANRQELLPRKELPPPVKLKN